MLVYILVFLLAFPAFAQSPADGSGNQAATPQVTFEVASIKLVNHSVPPHVVSLNTNHGRLTMDAAALRQIIGLAYSIQRVRVQGGPDWIDSDLFDIAANAENSEASRDDIRNMLQDLLADRFRLKVHHETKELTEYSLVLARNGSKLKETTSDASAAPAQAANVVTATPTGGITVQNGSLRLLVNTLANILGSPVVDKTGLTGAYDFALQWNRAQSAVFVSPNDSDSSGPSLFTALEEQLGLKLEATKAAGDVLIVDHADHPSEN